MEVIDLCNKFLLENELNYHYNSSNGVLMQPGLCALGLKHAKCPLILLLCFWFL